MPTDTGIWSLCEQQTLCGFDESLAHAIIEMFPQCSSIADLGCGPGYYARFFRNAGVPSVCGIDGTPQLESLNIFAPILQADLSTPLPASLPASGGSLWHGPADLVVSLEVGEHIPDYCASIYAHNLAAWCEQWLVISWATPGMMATVPDIQTVGHINEKSQDEVIALLERFGFVFMPRRSSQLREAASVPFFQRDLLVFGRDA